MIGLDQAASSGWGIASGRQVREHGVVRNPSPGGEQATFAAHRAVIARAIELADGDPARLLVAFEDHSGMQLTRLTNFDRTTRRAGRPGAPERSTASIIGLGKPVGYWTAVLDSLGHPRRLRIEVEPTVWRLRVHGVVSGDVKRAACDYASRHVGRVIADHNEAEAICIALFASIDGVAMVGREKLERRLYARGKREERRQLVLGDVTPAQRGRSA